MFSDQNILDIVSLLKPHFPLIDSSSIHNIQQIPIGADAQIYSFEIVINTTVTKLLLKLFRNRLPKERSENEYVNLYKLFSTTIRVPKAFGLLDNDCSFNRPFMVMEFVEGDLLGNVLNQNVSLSNVFFIAFIENLVVIHSFNWQKDFLHFSKPDIVADPFIIIKTFINRTNRLVQEYSISEFVPIIEWLLSNMTLYPCPELVFSHGDYHPGNIIVNRGKQLVNLDWSNVCLSDRRLDIAFAIVVLNSESKIHSDDLVVSTYEKISKVEIEGIDFFKVLTSLFNFLRFYSAACNYSITQETDETRLTFTSTYKYYCLEVLSIMKNNVDCSFPVIEKFLL